MSDKYEDRHLGYLCPWCNKPAYRSCGCHEPKDAIIAALKEKVRDLQDGHDLHSDEFERIKSLYPDNPELVGICSRAIKVIKQKVPVIVQRDNAIKDLATAENELDTLRKVVWWLDRYGAGWYLLDHKASVHNLDIPALKKGMGQVVDNG